MYYKTYYESPVGRLTLVSDEESLIGLWIEGQKYFESTMPEENVVECAEREECTGKDVSGTAVGKEQVGTWPCEVQVLHSAAAWLDRYFAGERPKISELPLAPSGSEFRRVVWKLLCEIPYGQVTTYGDLAKKTAAVMGRESMSAQAVGSAVGHNPISIIIPCHRVVGADGSLTGYAGGLEKKIWLLELEDVTVSGMRMPERKLVNEAQFS